MAQRAGLEFGVKLKAVPIHAMEALGGEEV
jgi:hypothetical protein